jgi:hypothetical protein
LGAEQTQTKPPNQEAPPTSAGDTLLGLGTLGSIGWLGYKGVKKVLGKFTS